MKNEDDDLKKEDQIKDVNKSFSEMSPIKYIEDLFEKMPFTKWHAIMVIAMFTLRLLEGTETMSISIASAMLVKELKLEESSTATISGIIFTGNFLGSILSCILSDKIPRKYSIFLGNILIVIFGGLSVLITDITYFIIYRNLVSLGIGLTLSSSTAIVAENINPNYRGFILNLIILSASFGEILISFSLGNIIDSSNHFEWRKLLFISYSPVLYQ
jgi:MFS family permease